MTKYDGEHRARRKRLAPSVAAGRESCWRCKLPIVPGEPWHLGHSDDGTRWMGPEHERCNTSAAGKVGNARRADAGADRRWSQHWFGGFDLRCPDCRKRRAPCAVAIELGAVA